MHDVDLQRLTATREATFEPSFERGAFGGSIGWSVRRMTDAQLTLAASVMLFALGAWPVMMVDVPPLQDLPNHLATISILEHPAQYPEFVFNGFLKTNAALFTWLYGVGKAGRVGQARRPPVRARRPRRRTRSSSPVSCYEITGSSEARSSSARWWSPRSSPSR